MNKSTIQSKLTGPVFPIITPFKKDKKNSIDYDSAIKYVDFLYENGVRNFYVMTYNSRFSLMSWDEMKEFNKAITLAVKSKDDDCICIVADPLTNPTDVSIEFAQSAQECGADMISMIFMERYYNDDQVFNHFNSVAKESDIGILVHEQKLPSKLGTDALYPLELLDRLADIENVIALKEDSKQPVYSESVIKRVGDRLNIIISGLGKRQFVHFHYMGCHAYLVGIGSFAPRVSLRFHKACLEDDMQTAWGIINEIERPFLEAGMKYGWHPALKSAMQEMNIMSRHERPPLVPISDQDHEDLRQTLVQIQSSKHYLENING